MTCATLNQTPAKLWMQMPDVDVDAEGADSSSSLLTAKGSGLSMWNQPGRSRTPAWRGIHGFGKCALRGSFSLARHLLREAADSAAPEVGI